MPRLDQSFFRKFNTKASDTNMPDEDVRLLVNANYEKSGGLRKVKGYEQIGDQMKALESQIFTSYDDFDEGTKSSTEANGDNLVLTGGIIKQDENNDSHTVYGVNWIAQSFKATSTSISKVGIYLDKVTGASLQSYDTFTDNSIDSAKWEATGEVSEEGGRLVLTYVTGGSSKVAIANTDNKTDGDPIRGGKWFQSAPDGTTSGTKDVWCQIQNATGTAIIRAQFLVDVGDFQFITTGDYGSTATRFSATSGTIEVRERDNNIELLFNGNIKRTLANQTIASNSHFAVRAVSDGGDESGTRRLILDDVNFYQDITSITDLAVRIEGDSSSAPDGSAISNGTTTLDDVDVIEGSVQRYEPSFGTAPTTVVGTTYWLVLKQTGGDANNYYRTYKQNSNIYTDGTTQVSTDSGGAWSDDGDAPSDLAFRIYGTYTSSGTWISPNVTLSSGQTLTQLVIRHKDLSANNKIDRVDITNTSNVVQSSYTTDITSGTSTTLRASDFDSGFAATLNANFRVKITLASGGTITPVVVSISIDAPETKILELAPLYQANGTRALLAVVAGTVFRFVVDTWTSVYTSLTTGLKTGSTLFRAYKGPRINSGTASAGDLTSLTSVFSPEIGANNYQGKFVKITGGTGVGQVRVIQSNTGTSTSTTTSTTMSTSTTTSTTTTTSTSTSTSTTFTNSTTSTTTSTSSTTSTTTTVELFNPDSDPETSSVDGIAIRSGVNEAWATIRAGAGTESGDTGVDAQLTVSASATTNQFENLRRAFYLFDTSGIADGNTINSAFLEVYVNQVSNNLTGTSLVVVGSTPASDTAIVTADYSQTATTALSSTVTVASITTGAYLRFTLNAAGKAAVSKTGITKLAVVFEEDRSNTAPTWLQSKSTFINFSSAEGANAPRLGVNHS